MANPQAEKARQEARDKANAREHECQAIFDLGVKQKQPELAQKAIGEGWTLEKFKARLLDERSAQIENVSRNFSLCEMILRKADGESLGRIETDVFFDLPSNVSKRNGAHIPYEILETPKRRALLSTPTIESQKSDSMALVPQISEELQKRFERRGLSKRDLTASSAAAGGNTVDTELKTLIMPLDAEEIIYPRCSKVFLDSPYGNANLEYPRKTNEAVASWVEETGVPTESNITFDKDSVKPKIIRGTCLFSRLLLSQASIDVEEFVRSDLRQSISLKRERDLLLGTGTGNEILGIANIPNLQTVNYTEDAITYDDVCAAEQKLLDANAIHFTPNGMKSGEEGAVDPALAWVVSPKMRRLMRQTPQVQGGELAIWDQGDKGNDTLMIKQRGTPENAKVLDYDAFFSTNVADNDAYLANWRECLVTHWGGILIIVDPFSRADDGLIKVVAEIMIHAHHRHNEAFARLTV